MQIQLEVTSGDTMGIGLIVYDENYWFMAASPAPEPGANVLVVDVPDVQAGAVYYVEVGTTMGSASGMLRFDIR